MDKYVCKNHNHTCNRFLKFSNIVHFLRSRVEYSLKKKFRYHLYYFIKYIMKTKKSLLIWYRFDCQFEERSRSRRETRTFARGSSRSARAFLRFSVQTRGRGARATRRYANEHSYLSGCWRREGLSAGGRQKGSERVRGRDLWFRQPQGYLGRV